MDVDLLVYGKWPFYRLGPIQEPFSVLMSLGNLYVNLQGINDLKRRVRGENKLRRWLIVAGYAQINTWFWSSVFHTRGRVPTTKSLIKDTPLTERLDYFSATITVSFSLIYALIRVLHLQTPTSTSRLLFPIVASVVFLVSSHFTYLLSFPLGQFPYGYHTKFVVCLGMVHNVLWILWSLSFKLAYPSFTLGNRRIGFPRPYPPLDPLQHRSINAMTPLSLVILTLLAMSFELFDFRPILRVVDAHSMWHAFTIPLAIGWWALFIQDAIDLESSQLNPRGGTSGGLINEKSSMTNISSSLGSSADSEQPGRLRTPAMSAFAQAASTPPPPRRSPGARSPVKDRQD